MSLVTYRRDAEGNVVSKSSYDSITGKFTTTLLSEEEKEALSNPQSQFSNLDLDSATLAEEKPEEPEPSFLQDVQRVGLKTAFGPVQLASDLVVRPFSADKEAYDKAADAFFRKSKEKVLTAFGEDDVTDVIDPKTGKIRGTDTLAGAAVDIGSYLVGGGAVFKVLNKINKTRKLGNVTKAVISEQVAEQALSDPDYNLANLAKDFIDADVPYLDYLAADEEDDVLLNRAKQSIVGGLTTGVVSGLVKLGFSRLEVEDYSQRIFNKDPEDLSHEIELPEVVEALVRDQRSAQVRNPSSVVQEVSERVSDTNEGVAQMLKQSEKTLSGRLQWIKQRFFTKEGFYSEEAFKAKEAAVSGSRQLVSSGVHHARRLQRFIDDELLATGDETIAKKVMEQLQNKSLLGLSDEEKIKRIVDSGLSKDIALEIVSARNIIDDLSKYIVDNNVATEGVRDAIIGNMGEYVTRSYRLFEDANYVPSDAMKEEASEFLVRGLAKKRGYDPDDIDLFERLDEDGLYEKLFEEADQLVDDILDKGESSNLYDYMTKVRKINKKVFAQRKDIAPEIRKLMGEIESPTENISITIQKLANITESHKFYSKLNQLGGSVPQSQALYKQAMNDARAELTDVDFVKLKEQFDIDVPTGTLFRLDDGRTASLIKRNENGSFRVNARDPKSGVKKQVTISADEAQDGFIPRTNVVKTLADEIYANKYNGRMTDASYLKKRKEGSFTEKITGTNSEIDGLFTTPELARAINNLEDTHMFWGAFKQGVKGNELGRYLSGVKGLSQQMKTVYDHTTHLRNALGGYQFGLANGINPLTQGKFNQATLWNEIFEGNNRIFDAYYERLQGLGVINTSVRARETRAMLDIASEARGPEVLAGKLEKLAEKFPSSKTAIKYGRKPEQIYMATDDFFKMNAFAAELSALKKIKPNAPLKQLEEEAAEIVKDTLPNYDRVTQGVKALRELPIGNFVSFPAEIIRTSANIVTRGTREAVEGLRTGNAALRNRGMQRLAGFSALNGGWFATGYLGSKALGLTDAENESYQTLLETDYDKNHNKVILNIGGEHFAMSPTYINSYNVFQDIALGIHQELADGRFEGKDLPDRVQDATVKALSAVIQPFTDEAMFVETMGDIYTAIKDEQGRTSGGKKIIKDPNDFWSVAWGSLTHAAKGFTPGFVTDFKKYGEALFEVPNEYTGLKRSLGARSVEMLTGLNFTKFYADDRFLGHARAYNREKNYARTRPTVRYGKESDDLFQEWTTYTSHKFKAAQQMYKQIQAMQNLGFDERRIYDLMQKAGLTSRSETLMLIDGRFSADNLSKKQKIDMIGKLKEQGEERPEQLITDFLDFASGTPLSPKTKDSAILNQAIMKEMSAKEFRKKFDKGGKVDVPDAKEEPDERIDRMTGLPYNQQAGVLGMDEEDPLRRLGFFAGGTYKIQAGDTLSEIAKRQDISQEELQRINRIENPDAIQAGATLKLSEDKEEEDEDFNEKDTANLSAEVLRNKILSPDNFQKEYEIDKRPSFTFFPAAQAATIRKRKPDPTEDLTEEEYSGIFGEGKRALHVKLNEIKENEKAGRITKLESGLQEAGARIDLVFAPVGELVGNVASALTPDFIEDPLKRKAAEIGQELEELIKEKGWERYADNINAGISIIGVLPTLRILKTGGNSFASNTRTKLENFYGKKTGQIDEKTGREITRPFRDDLEKNINQITTSGLAYLKAVPKTVADSLVPALIHRRNTAVGLGKQKEILDESTTSGQIQAADYIGSIAAFKNIVEQSKQKVGGLLKGSPIDKAYAHGQVNMADTDAVKDSLFNKYNYFDTPEQIQEAGMNHLYNGPWTEGIKISVKGKTLKNDRPLTPENTDIDIKRLEGMQDLMKEVHGDISQAAPALRKLFGEGSRSKFAAFLEQKQGKIKNTKAARNRRAKELKDDKVAVSNLLDEATPEDIKDWLSFDARTKKPKRERRSIAHKLDTKVKEKVGMPVVGEKFFGVDITTDQLIEKGDIETAPVSFREDGNFIYMSSSHTSKSKESGGVNDFIAVDLKTKDVYVMISDKHDMLMNLNPIGGKSRLTVAPIAKINLVDKTQRGKHVERDYKDEAQSMLDILDNPRNQIELPEGGVLSMPVYDPVTGLIPLGRKERDIIGKTKGIRVTKEDLQMIANAKKIEKVGDKYKVDGKVVKKGVLDGAANINASVLAHYAGKATAKDYFDSARRIGYLIAAGSTLSGERLTEEEAKEIRQGRLQRALKNTRS
jgi:hypothetical protein